MVNQIYTNNQRQRRGRSNGRCWAYVNLLILVFSMVYGGSVVVHEPDDAHRTIILLHTNDRHFNIKHSGAIQNKISRFRDHYTDVFLFDADDFTIRPTRWTQRNIVSNAEEYEKQMRIMVRNMNEFGYNAAVLGNHELGYYETVTRDVLQEADLNILLRAAIFEP